MTTSPAIATRWSEDVEALAAAISRMLEDMREDGMIRPTTWAQARIAYEPFADPNEKGLIMPIEEARRILAEVS
jgi:hypothetical protein